MSKSLLRLAFSLSLLAVILVLGAPRTAGACPRAVTVKYYGWVEASDPSFYRWCNYPKISPEPHPGDIVWQQIGQETTDCDGNYSSWGQPCQEEGYETSANAVRTSTACYCGS